MLLKIVCNFFAGIVVGFVLEFLFRSIEHKRVVIPKLIDIQMYALIGAFLVFIYYLNINIIYKLALIFIIPTCVEFLTGYIYLKIFRVNLWNYAHQKYNFLGLVCPLFSFFWFIISIAYYFFVLPNILNF